MAVHHRRKYASLNEIMSHLLQRPQSMRVVVQRRRHFNGYNYGEFCDNWFNESDHMLWDAFCPGYMGAVLRDKPYAVSSVLGVMLTATGNHKIIVRLQGEQLPEWCPSRAYVQAMSFRERYFMKKGIDCSLHMCDWLQVPKGPNGLASSSFADEEAASVESGANTSTTLQTPVSSIDTLKNDDASSF